MFKAAPNSVEVQALKDAINLVYTTLTAANYPQREEFKTKSALFLSYSNPKLANVKGIAAASDKAREAFQSEFNQAIVFLNGKDNTDNQSAKEIIQSALISPTKRNDI